MMRRLARLLRRTRPAVHVGAQDDADTGQWLMDLHAGITDPYERDAATELAPDFARMQITQNYRAARLTARLDALLDGFAPGWRQAAPAVVAAGQLAEIRRELVTA